jgi:hypothetical protein
LIVQPAPRIIRAPEKKRAVVDSTAVHGTAAYEAAMRVEKKHGKKR